MNFTSAFIMTVLSDNAELISNRRRRRGKPRSVFPIASAFTRPLERKTMLLAEGLDEDVDPLEGERFGFQLAGGAEDFERHRAVKCKFKAWLGLAWG